MLCPNLHLVGVHQELKVDCQARFAEDHQRIEWPTKTKIRVHVGSVYSQILSSKNLWVLLLLLPERPLLWWLLLGLPLADQQEEKEGPGIIVNLLSNFS
jgi:hypothetical protein